MRVGTNLQPGQRLAIVGEPEHAPLVRAVAEAGWRAGAGDVQVLYRDDHIRRLHAIHAAEELLDRTPDVDREACSRARAPRSVQLGDADPSCSRRRSLPRRAVAEPLRLREIAADLTARLATAWTVIACPTEGWAAELFGEPDVDRLWDEIAAVTRLDAAGSRRRRGGTTSLRSTSERAASTSGLRRAPLPRPRDGSRASACSLPRAGSGAGRRRPGGRTT